MQIQSWIPSIVSITTGVIAIAIAYAVTKTRVENLERARNEIKQDLDAEKKNIQNHLEAASRELQEAVKAIAILSREQAVINQVTATAMEAMTRRLETQERQISELNGSVKLLTELVKRLEKINLE